MKTKRILALLLAVLMVVSLAACGGNSDKKSDDKKDDAKAAVNPADNTIEVCLASEPDTIDPALNSAVDGATLLIHLFSGLAKWSQDENGKLTIVPDAAEELTEGVKNDDGTVTYTYKLRDGQKWSDGKDVTAKDFEFAWKRAASLELAADYGYMFEVVDGYAAMTEVDDAGNPVNPDAELNVKATDDKTLTVTLANDVPYWNELLAFPVYFPVREDVVKNEAWATDPATYVSNGMYKLDSWDHDSLITLKYNPDHVDASEVTMGTIEFYLSDDANNQLTNFKNGDWKLIDDVPTDEIATLKQEYEKEFNIVGQIGTYYVCWNINEDILPKDTTLTGADAEAAKAEIRNALSLVLDRNYIVNDVAQGGQVPASSFVAMGLTDADGSEFYKNTGVSADYDGYFNTAEDAFQANFDSAVETLKKYYNYDEKTKKFTNFPSLTYLYNTSEGHQAIGEYIQAAFDSIGVSMKLENQEWNTFLNTRKQGDFSIARNGWIADYNDPICFLDMWTTASGNNDVQFGKGDNAAVKAYSLDLTDLGYETKVENGTWAETYDVLISTIKSCTDTEKRYQLMHKAEDMIMATGCICPIYYYTDLYMLDSNVEGFFSNPLGYKYFMYCTYADAE
ncbi:MAG: peptide ABC transporter substrate-binding protein [Ruminococcus sp.]|nr:peptide ABC transporter substrate-binding protein [Ruminococcus sp.]